MVDTKIKIIAGVIIIIAVIGIAGIALQNKTTAQGDVSKNSAKKELYVFKVSGFDGPGTLPREAEPRIAEEFGYFNSIKIDYATLTGTEKVVAISTGEIDAAHDSYLNTIRAVSKGVKVKSVGLAHGATTVSYFDFYVLNNSAIKSAKDLKGKKIGTNKAGSAYLFIFAYLKGSNVSINDVQFISVPTGQGEQVLRSGQIDILPMASDYEKGALLEKGGARLLFSQSEVTPIGFYHCGITVSEKAIKEQPEIIKDYVQGFVKAADWEKANPDKNTDLYYKWAVEDGTKGADLVKKYHKPNDIRDHALQKDSDIQWFIDQLVELDELKPGQIKPSDIYTDEFNPYFKK